MLTACSKLTSPQHLANVQVNDFGKQIAEAQEKLGKTLGDSLAKSLGENLGQQMEKFEKALEAETKIF